MDGKIAQATQRYYYHHAYRRQQRLWFGYPISKYSDDLMAYQNIIHKTRPEVLVETGTYYGASALYFAQLFDAIGRGQVITIDIYPQAKRPSHPRIAYVRGSSLDDEIFAGIKRAVASGRCMVVLDSNHHYPHVLAELEKYHTLVTSECYLVVEDTFLNGHPVRKEWGPGPWEAVEKWLPGHPEFERPAALNGRLLTMNPGGWLRRT